MNFTNLANLRNSVKKLISLEKVACSLGQSHSGLDLENLKAWHKELSILALKQKRSEELCSNHSGNGFHWTKAAIKRDEQLELVREMAKKVLAL